MAEEGGEKRRLTHVELDGSIGRSTPDVEHERAVAIFDLLEENSFFPTGDTAEGPYRLLLALAEARLSFTISRESGEAVATHILSLGPFRRVVKDYFMVCDSYYEAIRGGSLAKIEAIDMGRRGLHDEAAQMLRKRLDGKIAVDFPTARRLFTLICVLQRRV